MKKYILMLLRALEALVVIAALSVFIVSKLSKPDNLEFGIQRIQGIAGYSIDSLKAELILHKSNKCDSVVMVKDYRSVDYIDQQMRGLVEADKRWEAVQVAEANVYDTIIELCESSYQTNLHFRPVCVIEGGDYDYMFVDKSEFGDAEVCLIDVETGTIVLYIYLH